MKQREIKFRAFNKKLKEMGSAMPLDVIVKSAASNPSEIEQWDDLIIMQFTGLKDKKGKEIYEGDVLEVKDAYQELFIVQYSPPGFYLFDGKDGALDDSSFTWEDWGRSKVIGNIYENPKLLE